MAKSVLEQTRNLLKSLAGGSPSNADDKEEKKKPEENTLPADNGVEGSDNGDEGGNGKGGEEPNLEKSLPDGYSDATKVLANLVTELKKSNDAVAELTKRMDSYEAEREEIEKSILEVAGSVKQIADAPLPTKSATSIQKSDVGGTASNGKFTNEDWTFAKSVLISAVKAGEITLEKSEKLSSACQKALHGGEMSRDIWNEMSVLCNKYGAK